MKIFILNLLCIFSLSSLGQISQIYDGHNQQIQSLDALLKKLSPRDIFILGEFHNTTEIQIGQAEFIEKFVNFNLLQNKFNLHWEFLNFTENKQTQKSFKLLLSNIITAENFLEDTAGKQNLSYVPLIETLKKLNGNINGLNLPRNLKQKIIQDGIDSIDAKYISPYHYIGGQNYLNRFTAIMGEHVPADQLAKYFEVQCLVDSTMAYQVYLNLINHPDDQAHFVVAGSFHTDFYQGTVERLSALTEKRVISFKFVSKTHQSQSEINDFIKGDTQYGNYADYIIVTE